MKFQSLVILLAVFSTSCSSPDQSVSMNQEQPKNRDWSSPYTWTLILSDSLIAKELEIQQAMVIYGDKNDPRLKQWARENAACVVADRLAAIPLATKVKPLLAIGQVLVTGPKELERELELLHEEDLIKPACLIDGPGIPAPILVD